MGSGKHHGNGANSRRSERRKNRYSTNLNDRIRDYDKRIQALTTERNQWLQSTDQYVGLDNAIKRVTVQRNKLVRMHDKPRKRAMGRHKGQFPRRSKWAQMRSDLNGKFGNHDYSDAAKFCKQMMETSR